MAPSPRPGPCTREGRRSCREFWRTWSLRQGLQHRPPSPAAWAPWLLRIGCADRNGWRPKKPCLGFGAHPDPRPTAPVLQASSTLANPARRPSSPWGRLAGSYSGLRLRPGILPDDAPQAASRLRGELPRVVVEHDVDLLGLLGERLRARGDLLELRLRIVVVEAL